jgi:hypothetical protein
MSDCPTCGEDGGTSCGMPNCGLLIDPAAEARRVAIVKMARDEHYCGGEVEVDDNALLSEGDDNGTYVQAWVWVGFAGTEFDKEKT